MIEMNVMKM